MLNLSKCSWIKICWDYPMCNLFWNTFRIITSNHSSCICWSCNYQALCWVWIDRNVAKLRHEKIKSLTFNIVILVVSYVADILYYSRNRMQKSCLRSSHSAMETQIRSHTLKTMCATTYRGTLEENQAGAGERVWEIKVIVRGDISAASLIFIGYERRVCWEVAKCHEVNISNTSNICIQQHLFSF